MTLVVREADARECRALGFEPEDALEDCVWRSDHAVNEYIDGELAACWGWRLRGFLTQNVDMWLLTSDVVTAHPIEFARRSKRKLEALLKLHPSIFVQVHTAYTDSVKWLLWLGFQRVDTLVVKGETFLIMRKDRG